MTDYSIRRASSWYPSRNHKIISSRVMMVSLQSGPWFAQSSISWAISMRSCLFCIAKKKGPNSADTLRLHKFSVKMECTDSVNVSTSGAISCIDTRMVFHDYSQNGINRFFVSACGWPTYDLPQRQRPADASWWLGKLDLISLLDVIGHPAWNRKFDKCALHVCTLGATTENWWGLVWRKFSRMRRKCGVKLLHKDTF